MKAYKNLIYFILSAIFAVNLSVFRASAQTGTVKGRVFNHTNNEPLPFVNIIIDGNPAKGTTSDIDGNYTLTDVPLGYIRLVATSVGFERYISEDFLVTRSHPVFIDIPMYQMAITLNDVVIKPSVFERRDESPLSLQTLSIGEIERSPGSNRDVSRVIQSLPGVATSVSYRNDVIVRGGGPAENRFYLDAVEIPYINHFATQGASGGPTGIINIDFLREVNLYSGAFLASQGNALSSVLELRQIDGNREKIGGRITLGSSDLALTLDGPITKNSSLIFSIRRSYLQLLFNVLELPFLPTYNDYQFKYKIDLNKKNQISLISIGALDKFKLNTGLKDPDAFQEYILESLPANDQWSYAVGLVYRHFREKGNDTWVLSRNMLNNDRIKYKNNYEAPDSLLLNYNSQEIENKFRYEGVSELSDWTIQYGGGLEYVTYKNQTYQKLFLVGELRVLDYSTQLSFFKYGIFSQATKPFFRDRLTLSLGIRLDGNTYSSRMANPLRQFSPRFSASWSFTEKWFLNFNTGRYYQLPQYTSLGFRNNYGTLVNDSLGIEYISSDHIVLGAEFRPRSTTRISLEGFYKFYRDYPLSLFDSVSLASKGGDYGVVGDEPVIPVSKGRAYGFEVFYRDTDLFKFNILLSYTFVRSEFTNYFGTYLPSSWDNIHLLNITVGRKFKHNWEVGLKWRFAGGVPYTPYDEALSSLVTAWDAQGRGYLDFDRFNSERLRSFNQLDLRVDKGFYFKKWSLMVYLDIQNVANFKAQQPDILVNTQPDGTVQTYVDDQGQKRYNLRYISNTAGTILPSIGIMVDF